MDIVMCSNRDCAVHEECYHFMAVPSKTQVYVDMKSGDGECKRFWPMDKAPGENQNV